MEPVKKYDPAVIGEKLKKATKAAMLNKKLKDMKQKAKLIQQGKK